jgi:hypothetical protein
VLHVQLVKSRNLALLENASAVAGMLTDASADSGERALTLRGDAVDPRVSFLSSIADELAARAAEQHDPQQLPVLPLRPFECRARDDGVIELPLNAAADGAAGPAAEQTAAGATGTAAAEAAPPAAMGGTLPHTAHSAAAAAVAVRGKHNAHG